MTLRKKFGKKLKALRESQGLTQQELAELVNMQPNSIGQIEIGYKAVSFNTIERLSQKLNVSYYELFDFEDCQTSEILTKSLLHDLQTLDIKTLKFVVTSVKNMVKFLKKGE